MRRLLAGLPRTVWLLGTISLINDAASDMIYPLVPLYVASALRIRRRPRRAPSRARHARHRACP